MSTLSGNDEILLLTVLALRENAYGVTIMQHLTSLTKREWSIGAIYDPLHRLEKSGLVRSELTSPTPERGGRSKRVYQVTEDGLEALRRHREVRRELTRGVPDTAPDTGTKS